MKWTVLYERAHAHCISAWDQCSAWENTVLRNRHDGSRWKLWKSHLKCKQPLIWFKRWMLIKFINLMIEQQRQCRRRRRHNRHRLRSAIVWNMVNMTDISHRHSRFDIYRQCTQNSVYNLHFSHKTFIHTFPNEINEITMRKMISNKRMRKMSKEIVSSFIMKHILQILWLDSLPKMLQTISDEIERERVAESHKTNAIQLLIKCTEFQVQG